MVSMDFLLVLIHALALLKIQASRSFDAKSSSASSCPFSRSFERYRIDLTRVAPKENPKLSLSIPLLGDMQKSWAREKVEKANPGVVQWLEGQDGLEALASLWRAAADLMESSAENTAVLAFTDAQPRVIRQWMDIVDWMQAQDGLQEPSVSIETVLVDEDLPTIRITRKGDPVLEQPQSRIDPSILTKQTQAWVQRVLVDLSICPFTKSTKMSGQGLADVGVPVGRIAYCHSYASKNQICQLMADTWEAIRDMIAAGPSGRQGISSILLAAPAFDDDFPLWAGPVFCMLEAGVIAAGAEKEVGVVCFHPAYATPDGSTWPGFGQMHSVPRLQKWLLEDDPACPLSTDEVAAGGAWQRRTPYATINVLRADQLEAAEGRRTTGKLYSENIKKLVGRAEGIGSDKLQEELNRDRSLGLS